MEFGSQHKFMQTSQTSRIDWQTKFSLIRGNNTASSSSSIYFHLCMVFGYATRHKQNCKS